MGDSEKQIPGRKLPVPGVAYDYCTRARVEYSKYTTSERLLHQDCVNGASRNTCYLPDLLYSTVLCRHCRKLAALFSRVHRV